MIRTGQSFRRPQNREMIGLRLRDFGSVGCSLFRRPDSEPNHGRDRETACPETRFGSRCVEKDAVAAISRTIALIKNVTNIFALRSAHNFVGKRNRMARQKDPIRSKNVHKETPKKFKEKKK